MNKSKSLDHKSDQDTKLINSKTWMVMSISKSMACSLQCCCNSIAVRNKPGREDEIDSFRPKGGKCQPK